MDNHKFNVSVAKDYGINCAIILGHFAFMYEVAKSHEQNYFDGASWVRLKAAAMANIYPYFTLRQIRFAIDKLVDAQLVLQSEYNIKRSDRTKWYTLTEKAKIIYNIEVKKVGYKNVTNNSKQGYKIVTPGYKNVTSNNKEVNITCRYNNIEDKIIKNLGLLEIVCMRQKISLETAKEAAHDFAVNAKAIKKTYNNDTDLFSHFRAWVNKQDYSDVDLEKQINWFISAFNSVSKKEFKITDTTRQLFARQFQFGFTGAQMKTAIENLYSSSVYNKYHVDSKFKFASPNYLLKEDNVNRYLNLKH